MGGEFIIIEYWV